MVDPYSGSSSPLSSLPSPPRDATPTPPPPSRRRPKSKGFVPPSKRRANQSTITAINDLPNSSITYKPASFTTISHSLFLSHLETLQAEIWRLSQEAGNADIPDPDLGNQWTRIWNYAEASLGKLVVCVECDSIHPQSWLTKQAEDVKKAMKGQQNSNLSVLNDLRSQLRQLEIDYILRSHVAGDDGTGSRGD